VAADILEKSVDLEACNTTVVFAEKKNALGWLKKKSIIDTSAL
jgi:hypothetical protein